MLSGLRFGINTLKLMCTHLRTQMFIDAEARMDTYEDKDGVKRTQLNLLMRTSRILSISYRYHLMAADFQSRQLRSAQPSSELNFKRCSA